MSKIKVDFHTPNAKAIVDARDECVISDSQAADMLARIFEDWCDKFAPEVDVEYYAEEYTRSGAPIGAVNICPSDATDYFVEKDVVDFVTVEVDGMVYPGLYRWDDGHVLVLRRMIDHCIDAKDVRSIIELHLGDMLIEIEKKIGLVGMDWNYYADPCWRFDDIEHSIMQAVMQCLADSYGIEVKEEN